jgi:hypothetical protein
LIGNTMINSKKVQYFLLARFAVASLLSPLERFSSNSSSFSSRRRFYCLAFSISMMRSRILLVPLPPLRLREGKMDMPVPRWKVLPLMEASSDLAARLRESSRFISPLGFILLVLPVLEMEWSCSEGECSESSWSSVR